MKTKKVMGWMKLATLKGKLLDLNSNPFVQFRMLFICESYKPQKKGNTNVKAEYWKTMR